MKAGKSTIPAVIVGLVVLAVIVYAFLPSPVGVDLGQVSRGPLRVTVDEDGMTRVKDHYVISSPVMGRLRRIELEPGDPVRALETIVAVIEPSDPQLLDSRAQAQSEARVKAAEAAQEQAQSNLDRARQAHDFASSEFERTRRLWQDGLVSEQNYESVEFEARSTAEAKRAAEFAVKIADFEVEQARAALLFVSGQDADPNSAGRLEIRAPVGGRVLKRYQESSVVVSAGTPLLELGDPTNLEIIIDVLSTDAVQIAPGTKISIEHWGGPEPLSAQVRLVEPAAFTKISVLGVEEQRVWVVADFVDPPARRATLGDAYRIEARIVIWEGQDVLRVPASALFRADEDWAVFSASDGRAHRRSLRIGRQNGLEAEVLDGLSEGDEVVLYPSDQVADGVKIIAAVKMP